MHFLISLIKVFFFVPYRGATFLNSWYNSLMVLGRFPSPIGELHFSIIYALNVYADLYGFPSPIGELHFSILIQLNRQNVILLVSVPYRGATFLNGQELLCSRRFGY